MAKTVKAKRAPRVINRSRKHAWLTERGVTAPHLVLRIDHYQTTPDTRGQFYPDASQLTPHDAPGRKAIWPNAESAASAAKWAAQKFGHTYGVFKLVEIIEQAAAPIKTTKV